MTDTAVPPAKRKRMLRTIGLIVAVPLSWVMIFAVALLNWGHISANQIEVKYDILGHTPGTVLLAGSSTMQAWTTSREDLGPLATENIGIGGTVTASWEPLIDRLITPFDPAAVVLYIGANDLHNDLADPADVAANLTALLERVHAAQPRAQVYWVSVYTTLEHVDLQTQDTELNDAIRALAQASDYLTYIDVATPLLGSDGKPLPEAFSGDGVHLNAHGYAIYAEVLRSVLLDETEVNG